MEKINYAGASHFANDANYEVQRANHFEIVIDLAAIGFGEEYQEAIRLCCVDAPIPQISIQAQQLKHGNETVNVAGSPSWGSVNIKIYDVIGKDMAGLLQEWFYKVFDPETHTMGLAVNYKTTATIYMCSPDCSVNRTWTLYGVFPTRLDFGSGNAEQQGSVITVSMELSVDKAIEKAIK